MAGPAGKVGVAVAEAVPETVPEVVSVLVVVVLSMYTVRRLAPPQYSVALPLQVMEQPFRVGSAPPVASTAPGPKASPQ